MKKIVLVTGATGAQGNAVVKQLLQSGIAQRVLLTEKDDPNWFLKNGIEVAIGNFGNEASLVKAMEGVSHLSLVFPLIYDYELLKTYKVNVGQAISKSLIERVVFNTSLGLPPQKTGSIAADIKLEMLEYFQSLNLPLVTITPSFYLDNHVAPWALPVILNEGIIAYPLPADFPFAWLSHFNLAQFTEKALFQEGIVGEIFPIGGFPISGNEIAEKFSKVLGKPIQYKALTPSEFKAQLSYMYPEEVSSEISEIYGKIGANPEPFIGFYNQQTIEKLGVKLETVDEWLNKLNLI